MALKMIGFDGDDTLWRSEDYFAQAQATFESIMAPYVELRGAALHERLYAVEKRNLAVFGYGVKGMALSMIETAIEISQARIAATDIHRIEIVSEKDTATYRRLLEEFGIAAHEFAMVGNSLRSDIAPVIELGGVGVHIPYHLTWVHERDASVGDPARVRELADAGALFEALVSIESSAA